MSDVLWENVTRYAFYPPASQQRIRRSMASTTRF